MNTNNGLMFGMEGPNMEGTWYNPKTGDSFTVRNSFFQDNQYIVQTTDGRVLDYNTLQSYIQSDKPIEMSKNVNESLPSEVANLIEPVDNQYDILPDDLEIINGSLRSLGNFNDPNPLYNGQTGPSLPPANQDFIMIEKALIKKSIPDIQISIDWKDFPQREMDMLIDIMDVNIDDIITWYTNQVDINYLSDCLKMVIQDHINSKLTPVTTNIEIPMEVTIEEVPVKEKKTTSKRESKSKSKTKK